MALLGHFLGGEYFDYQVKCGQGYSGRLAFKAGGGAPQWKEFRPLSEATVSEAAVSELTKGETNGRNIISWHLERDFYRIRFLAIPIF